MENVSQLVDSINKELGIDHGIFLLLLYSFKYNVSEITKEDIIEFYKRDIVPLLEKGGDEARRIISAMVIGEQNINIDYEK